MMLGNKNFSDAKQIFHYHFNQTKDDVISLKNKYKEPVFGTMLIWEAIEKLAFAIDPTDKKLGCVSQYVHTLQVIEAMEKDNVKEEEVFVAGWVHDLGKLLLLVGEEPENVVCGNRPIGKYSPQCGLNNCTFQWNHDEFIFDKMQNLLSPNILWLIRYHSIDIPSSILYMNQKDKQLLERYLLKFKKYDKASKSIYNIPKINLSKHQKMLEKHFPKVIAL